MTRHAGLTALRARLLAALLRHRVELGLVFRVTAAAVIAFALARSLSLALPLWAVLTSVIVTQLSVGRSLKVTLDYLLGTVGGAIYGGVLGMLVPHADGFALVALLAAAIAPTTFLAALVPRLNVAPITAIIVVLLPTMTHASSLASAIDRVIEVGLGALVGLMVSFLLLPANAHHQAIAAAAEMLERLAGALEKLLAGLTQGLDVEAVHRIQDGIGHGLAALNAVGAEAERERAARLVMSPDTAPLLRTLLRLRHDLVIIGRAAGFALPEALAARLRLPVDEVAAAAVDYLRRSSAALGERAAPPSAAAVEQALQRYGEAVASLRRDGLTRGLPGDEAERFFAIGFALEQMRQNFLDLERCLAEWAHSPRAAHLAAAQRSSD